MSDRGGQPSRRDPEDVLKGTGAAELLERWLEKIRKVLYPETLPESLPYQQREPFFRDAKLLREAVTWPAAEQRRLGWDVGEAINTQLIEKALRKIVVHATVPVGQIRRRAAFFYKVLQDEWRHNWDHYYEESKRHAASVEAALADLHRRGQPRPAAEPTRDILAEAHQLVKARGGRPKGKARPSPAPTLAAQKELAPREIQSELF